MGARGRGARKRRTQRRQAMRAVHTTSAVTAAAPEEAPVDEAAALEAIRALGRADALARSPRVAVRDALVASGEAPSSLLTVYDMTQGSLGEQFFVRNALEAGYTEVTHDAWPSEVTSLEVDETIVFRCDDDECVYRLADGTWAHVRAWFGMIRVATAGPSVEAGRAACAQFRSTYPASYLTASEGDTKVPVTFWADSPFGPVPRLRRIDSTAWQPIEGNYAADAKAELERLMGWNDGPDSDGQLLLWQGPPGTGKTWALRALASEWAPWAEFHYITDPDAFFVSNPSYMIDVLLSDSYMAVERETGDIYQEDDPLSKWRVLILEDTGELLAAQAKEQYGQGLSRLLNVVDGMIGQGLRVLAIVTTNDELGDLHPAVSRPGRCASQITFGPLSPDEASAFLGEPVEDGGTLAELYARSKPDEAAEALDMDTCAMCGHPEEMHAGEGACTMDGCLCETYQPREEVVATAQFLVRPTGVSLTDEVVLSVAESLELTDGYDVERVRAALEQFSLEVGYEVVPSLPDEHQPGERVPETQPGPVIAEAARDAMDGAIEWTAIFAPEGKLTSDGRAFAPGSISWRELPLTLMAMIETSEGGHIGAEVAGRIDRIWRDEAAGLIRAAGVFAETDYGSLIAAAAAADPEWFDACLTASVLQVAGLPEDRMLAASLVANQTLRGVSVDLAISRYEVGPKSDWFDEDGNWAPVEAETAEADEPSLLDILFGEDAEDSIAVVLEAEIGMTTVCPFPAFAEAKIAVGDSLVAGANPGIWTITSQAGFTVTRAHTAAGAALTASAAAVAVPASEPCVDCQEAAETLLTAAGEGLAPLLPPVEWFQMEEPAELGPLNVTDEGQFWGWAAAWEVAPGVKACHIGIPGRCQPVPTSPSGYAYFHLGEVVCAEGERVSVGTITLDTGHAENGLSRAETVAHYDHTGTATAYVVARDGEHGIFVCGAIRPDVPAEKVTLLRGAKLSGDWRKINGALELVAVLTVNVPGFPVPHARQLVASGEVVSLVAAGIPVFAEDLPDDMREKFAALAAQQEFAALAQVEGA